MSREVLRRLWALIRQRPGVGLALGALLAFVVWSVLPGPDAGRPRQATQRPSGGDAPGPRLLSPEVQLQGEVHRLREEYGKLLNRFEELRKKFDDQQREAAAKPKPSGQPEDLSRIFGDVPRVPPRPVEPPQVRPLEPPATPAPPRLTRFKIVEGPLPPPSRAAAPAPSVKMVHLPAGSFLSATLLSGVYAPVRGSQPFPVLLHFNEAAFAPNRYRVPVERCVAIAKAVGDYVSRRAILQLDQLSCTLPDGRVFTAPLAGWVSGPDGVLGIPGEIIEHTGSFLAKVALSAFIQGGAAALAQAETTITTTPLGGTQTTVAGNTAQFAALQGLATTAERMSRFFERQLETLVPVIFVRAGITGAAVIQNGVTIEGLPLVQAAGDNPWRTLD
ncbi:MAG: TraB/VirB10 family protein [Candidatus Rokuibacteriota bacterium]